MLWRRKAKRSEASPSTETVRRVSVGDRTVPADELGLWTAVEHAPATVPVNRAAVQAEVRGHVAGGLNRGSWDDVTSDALDGLLAEMRRGWDEAVETESRQRRFTLRRLASLEQAQLVRVQDEVRELRRKIAELDAHTEAWRAVLRGAPTFTPMLDTSGATHNSAPVPVLPVDLHGLLGRRSDAPTADQSDLTDARPMTKEDDR